MCCCRPAGSLPPPSDSPNLRLTVPEQHGHRNQRRSVKLTGAILLHFSDSSYKRIVPHSYIRVIQLRPFFFFVFFRVAHCGLAVVTLHRARVSF